jgi:hypothetical protein
MARRLEEQSARFRIHSVVPMDSAAADRELHARVSGDRKGREHPRLGPDVADFDGEDPAAGRGLLAGLSGHAEGLLPVGPDRRSGPTGSASSPPYAFRGQFNRAEDTREQLASRLRDALAPERSGFVSNRCASRPWRRPCNPRILAGCFWVQPLPDRGGAPAGGVALSVRGRTRGEEIGTCWPWGFCRARCADCLLGEAVGLALLGSLAWAWPPARSMPGR